MAFTPEGVTLLSGGTNETGPLPLFSNRSESSGCSESVCVSGPRTGTNDAGGATRAKGGKRTTGALAAGDEVRDGEVVDVLAGAALAASDDRLVVSASAITMGSGLGL